MTGLRLPAGRDVLFADELTVPLRTPTGSVHALRPRPFSPGRFRRENADFDRGTFDALPNDMPSPAEILSGLTAIAQRALFLAVGWHVIVAATLVAIALGWRPSQRSARAWLGTPLLSVGLLATWFQNPFNGAVFVAAAIVLMALARGGKDEPIHAGPTWTLWTGGASVAFGWVYPHFLEVHPTAYLVAAPLGIVPCPSLALVLGAALLGGGLGSRAWATALAALGLFYGLFGVLRLGVLLDLGLVLAAGALFIVALGGDRSTQPSAQRA